MFQFTVVNLKPKRIPPSLITAIAGLSLTRAEHDQVQARLEAAGVKVVEVEIMSLVAFDESSPFNAKVNMSIGGHSVSADRLGYGGMKRIAKVWYRAKRSSLVNIARSLHRTENATKARTEWREQRDWFSFFCAFWTAVRDNYAGALWSKESGSNLFVGANLWALQEVLLSALDGQVPSHWHLPEDTESAEEREKLLVEKMVEVLTVTLQYFPEDLWRVEWQKASQDTNAGRKELKELFERFVEEGKSAANVWKGWRSHPWFKKSSS